jgi:hypothetical protein
MNVPVIGKIVLVIAMAALAEAQVASPPGVPPSQGNRFEQRRRPVAASRPSPTTNRSSQVKISPKQRMLYEEANELTKKVFNSGPWANHAAVIERGIESIWAQDKRDTETDQFMKRLLVDVNKVPPWNFYGRLNVAADMIKQRYGLDDQQVAKFKVRFVQNSISFFLVNAEKLVPVAKDMIETRLANKPFTPEQVAAWTKVLRPIAEKWVADSQREVQQFAEQVLTPEQRARVSQDMAIIDKRFNRTLTLMKTRWETGQWTPAMWGLENDTLHVGMQARRDVQGQGGQTQTDQQPGAAAAPTVDRPRGPMRFGESQGQAGAPIGPGSSPLPDESTWVAYVKQFCDRYNLSKAQRASAFAVLKDLQDQAQAYRSRRIDEIKRLQERISNAASAEERNTAQSELREALSGIDTLFTELKARLDNIPTAEQLGGTR